MEKKVKNKERRGTTKITSVSVSFEFDQFIKKYDLSPTDCLRRGVAVTLFDLGVETYQSNKNEERFKYVQKFLKTIEEEEKLKEEYENIKLFKTLKNNILNIKNIINNIEKDE